MTCGRARENLDAYVDEQVGLLARVSLRRHLHYCADCRAALEQARALSRQLAELPAPVASAAVREAVAQAAREARPAPAGRRRRLAFSFAGGAVVLSAFLLYFVTRPEAALARVAAAAANVKSCRFVLALHDTARSREELRKTWYQEGKWRMEDWRDGVLREVQVHDGQRLHTYLPEERTVLLNTSDQPFGRAFTGFSVTQLVDQAGGRHREITRDTVRRAGRTLNRFVVTTSVERTVLFADPETDLPVSYQVYQWRDDQWVLGGGSDTLEFNVSLDPRLFVLTYPKDVEVVDRSKGERTRLEATWDQRYETGVGSVTRGEREIVVHDLQVLDTGEVYVIWSGLTPMSGELTLTDSAGNEYVRRSTEHTTPRGNAEWFIPAPDAPARANWYELTVHHGPGLTVRVTDMRRTAGEEPVYPVGGYRFHTGDTHAYVRAVERAAYWDRKGKAAEATARLDRAVALWESSAELQHYPSPEQWRSIGDLYRRAGRRDRAGKAYIRALSELDRAERDPRIEYGPGVADEYRAGLEAALAKLK